MKLNYLSIFTLIFIFFFAMNFIAAEEIGENCTDESLKIDLDTQDAILSDSSENSISDCDNEDIGDSEILSSEDSIQHIYVSPDGQGDGSSYENSSTITNALSNIQDNTIIHLAEGNYTMPNQNKKTITLKSINNITIMADASGKVIFKSPMNSVNYNDFEMSSLSNVTFKDIIFQGGDKGKWAFDIDQSNGVYFENCTFVNYNNYKRIIRVSSSRIYLNYCNISNNSIKDNIISVDTAISTDTNVLINNCIFKDNLAFNNGLKPLFKSGVYAYLTICGCEFINNNGSCLFYASSANFETTGEVLFNLSISSSVFSGNINNIVLMDSKLYTLFFENNTVDEGIVELAEGRIISPTNLTVLNNTQVTAGSGETVDITFVLTDDKGNIIKVPEITFKLDSNPCNATYDSGAYHYSYTAPEVSERTPIYIDTIECNYISNPIIKMQTEPIIVKPSLNMSAEDISDSVYGDEITVKVNISNLQSGDLVYEFVNNNGFTKTVTDSFTNNVSTVSLNDLPAGDYTLTVKYVEDDDFAASTITKTFTVNKANSTIENLIVDSVIPVGNNITVLAVVPSTYTGNVTYRLNKELTVDVGENAVFNALSNGTYTVYAKYNGDDNYNPSEEFNVTFRVVKLDPELSISHSTPVVINEAVTITVTMNDDITEMVDVIVNGAAPESRQVNKGILEFTIVPGFGDYNITVSFKGNEKYNEKSNSTLFTVSKLDADLNINTASVSYGTPLVINVTTNNKFTGDITVYAGKYNQTAHIVNGVGNATFTDLPKGDYSINATFTETEIFNGDYKNTTAAVRGFDTPLVITYSTLVIGENVTVKVTMKEDINDNVTVTVNNMPETKEVKSGVLEFNVLAKAGDYNITVSFKGSDKYNEITNSTQFHVDKLNADLSIAAESVSYGAPLVVKVTTNNKFTGDITVYAGKYNQTAHIVNGVGNATFTDLPKGDYSINATFSETEIFNGDYKNTTAAVRGFDTPLVITYSTPVIGENVTVKVTMKEDINDNVTVTVNNMPETKEVKSGVLEFNLLAGAGDYNITVSFKGSDKYNEITNSTKFHVDKLNADLSISAESVSYGAPLVVKVTTNTRFTGDIVVYANGFNQTAHIINGVGNATFADLPADNYVITATFSETEMFNGDYKNTTATVKGVEVPASQAFNTNVPSNSKSPTFSIKLNKDATGTFTVSVDGKVIETKELKDGAASITVNNLAAGNHKISVSYSGDGKYAAISQNTTLNIKEPAKPVVKKATKIVAKKKTFKAKTKVKKYTITLKSGKTLLKKVKVTLKVKGKTYTVKTNKKGKAVFKIKNLKKKGKYTATIKFKGNKNYKPATKKVKITVKK